MAPSPPNHTPLIPSCTQSHTSLTATAHHNTVPIGVTAEASAVAQAQAVLDSGRCGGGGGAAAQAGAQAHAQAGAQAFR